MAYSATDHYEVRYRVKDSGEAWSKPYTVAPLAEVVVEGLDRTQTYEFEVRAVSACGAKSVWVSSDYTVPGAPIPTPIDTLTAQSLADGVHLGWTSIAIPAAGVESSIERSADGSTGWAERARVRSTAYTDPEPTGTTWYYRVRYIDYAGQTGAYSPVASSAGVDVSTIGTNAANALADATAAQTDADAANAALADIASDNILSPGEKPTIIRDNNVILAEQPGIDAQASAYGITTEKTAYDNAVSAQTTYLATLMSPVLWSDLTGNTTIVGTTFRQKFADVYTTRQTLLNAIYAAAKVKADTAQSTANTAVGQVTQMPVINGGFDIAPTGYGWAADSGTWSVDTSSTSPGVQPNCARRNGSGATPNDTYRNTGLIPVYPGQIVKSQALIKAVGANGSCYVRVSWRDASLAELSVSNGNTATGTATVGSYVVGTAPAGAVFAKTELAAVSHTTGYYLVDNVLCTQYPSSMDEVPDSTSRFAAAQAGADKTSSNTANDTAHVAGATASAVSDGAGRAQAGFDSSGYLISGRNTLDRIGDSGTYARVSSAQVKSGVVTLLGTGRNAVPNPTFTSNFGAFPNNVTTVGSYIRDGWQLGSLTAGASANFDTSPNAPAFVFVAGIVVPASTQVVSSWVGSSFAVQAGSAFAFRSTHAVYLPQAMQSGLSADSQASVDFFTAAGVYISSVFLTRPVTAGSAYVTDVVTGLVPATAATARVSLFGVIINSTGSAITTAYPLTCETYWPNVEYVQASNLDNEVIDGASFGRTSQTDLVSNRIGLRVPGSGQRVGDQRNLVTRTIGNIPARVPSVISYSAPSGSTSPVTVTFSLAAFTMQAGSYSVAYGAMSASMSVTRGTAYNVFFYFNDPDQAGGTPTLVATTNAGDVYGGDGFVYVGSVTFTIPTSGGSSGGGGGGGAGGCVDCGQYLPTGQRAWDVVPGDVISGSVGGLDAQAFTVSGSRINDQPCWQLVTASGASVTASESTPMTLRDGTMSMFPDMLGEHVVVMDRDGATRWEQVTHMRYVGLRPVNQISIGGNCYFAGDTQGAYILTHNNIMPK